MKRFSGTPVAVLALLTVPAACGAPAGSAPSPREDVSIDRAIRTEVRDDDPGPVMTIVFYNDAARPILLASITLVDCLNVKNRCDFAIRKKLVLQPHSHTIVERVQPASGFQPFRFRD